MRIALLRALVITGTLVVLVTELASWFDALTRPVFAACWAVALAVALYRTEWKLPRVRVSLAEGAAIVSIAIILLIVGYTALLSPPNSADAMAYHLPRVLMWIQQKNVSFFPTSYLNLVMLQPVAEYFMLHLYLLTGGDRLTNLVQFTGFAGSIIGVSSIAQQFGLSRRAQILSALFVATLPNAILQASGAKNDCLLSLWLVCAVLFARRRDLVFLALSCGLALGTKGTAYLFLPAFLASVAVWRASPRAFGAIAAGVLLINGPQYWRNVDLSGSPLGFDSSHADGAFRWRNEYLGWQPTVSNILRNFSEQVGARSELWNQRVYATVVGIHQTLGLNPQDPATTWRWTEYRPPRNSNHEADANNRWHLLLMAVALIVAILRKERPWLLYAIGPAGGFLLFCFYLKWQPFFSRLLLPLFIIAAPLVAMALARFRPALQMAICVLLLANTRLALTENWTRPLAKLRTTPRELNYFNDMVHWNNRESYLAAVQRVAATSCRLVGLDNLINHVEYPFQALLLARQPDTRFVHVAVENPSAKYSKGEMPCAVLCIDCADAPERLQKFGGFGPPQIIGRFALFIR